MRVGLCPLVHEWFPAGANGDVVGCLVVVQLPVQICCQLVADFCIAMAHVSHRVDDGVMAVVHTNHFRLRRRDVRHDAIAHVFPHVVVVDVEDLYGGVRPQVGDTRQ